MLQSELVGKTLREAPKDEPSANAQLLLRAGYIDKLMAGVYSYLPLGLSVLKKIEQVIREEMNALGAQEVLLPALHPKENWEVTGRWDVYRDEKVMYQFTDHSGRELGLGPTHEEIITPLAKRDISSYRDLPMSMYQFQTKFRSELRAKSGLLRGREFIMKDLYSFHATEEDFNTYYERSKIAYKNVFDRVGIGAETVLTFASGGSFSKYSHEFQTLTEAGEDTIYLCDGCRIAVNKEIIADQTTCPQCGKGSDTLREVRAIEVGNIFPLKTKYSEPFRLTYKDETGAEQPVLMGCYGIGLGRLMGAIVEVHHDEKGIRWPAAVAPYRYHVLRLGDSPAVVTAAVQLAAELESRGTVLVDDRDVSAGVKFNDAELMGMPTVVVVSEKTLAAGKFEVRDRATGEVQLIADVREVLK